ncbi:efflux RND transporter permease subunit [Leptospira semungkisensis]|uniref:Efflux RND transporter permease subunit n=1 Tax=Leptospira semungkisensis TaxID=2484985 RepID=A0A4R9FR28_9LEPT|nr:efflux RND transporter permease subunit [Leptospira semungkisensis]TGK00825.1 efflux RND transporter permease subunit [Leptospira semungkisensis]
MFSEGSHFFSERPLTISMILGGLLLFGILAFLKVPVTLFPSASYPGLSVSVEYPGADVHLVEETLTIPIEEMVSSVGGIEEMRSFAERGRTEINLEFQKGVNLDLKSLEIRERIDAVAGNFPREVHKPLIFQYDPDQKPILIISIESKKFDFITLRSIADHEVKSYLENIEGVSKVAASGGKVREVLVACDLQKLRAHGVDLQEIQRVIQANNQSASIGSVQKEGLKYNLFLSGKYRSIREIQRQPIFSKEQNRIFYLEDVADVSFSFQDEASASRLSGKEIVSIFVYKSSVGNILDIAKAVQGKLEGLKIPDVDFRIVYDQSDSIRKTYSNVAVCFLAGVILMFVLMQKFEKNAFTDTRLTILLQFPLNFFIIQFLLFLLKVEFDLIIAGAEIVGFGVWLFIYKFLCERKDPGVGIFKFRNTLGELISFVIVVLALCLPLYYLDRDTGQSTLRLGVFLSLFVSLSYVLFIPLHASIKMVRERYFRSYHSVPVANTVQDKPSRLIRPGNRLFAILYIAILLFGVFRLVQANKELFYSAESKRIIGYVELPAGFNFPQTNSITKNIEAKIAGTEGVADVTSKVEPGHSLLVINVDESKSKPDDLIQDLRKNIGNVDPAFCYFSRESEGSRYKEIRMDALGDDYDKLDSLTKDLANRASDLLGTSDTVLNYKSPRDELELSLNNNKASGSSLNHSEIANFLKTAIQGSVVSKYVEENRELDIKIRAKEEFRNSVTSVERFVVKNQVGKYVPIPEVSSKTETKSPARISRKNKKRVLSFSLRASEDSYRALQAKVLDELNQGLPENYHVELGRSVEKAIEAENRLYIVIAFSFLLIYMVFASYFESLTRPFEVIATILFVFFLNLICSSLLFGKISLPVYLGLLLTIALVSFQILCLGKILKDTGSGFKREIYLVLCALFLFQILFSREGGRFLMELETTLLLGIGLSLAFTPSIFFRFEEFFRRGQSLELRPLPIQNQEPVFFEEVKPPIKKAKKAKKK